MWIGLVIRSLILTAVGLSEKQNVLGTFLRSPFKLKGIQRRKYTHGYLVNVWFYRRPKRDYMKKWPDVSYILKDVCVMIEKLEGIKSRTSLCFYSTTKWVNLIICLSYLYILWNRPNVCWKRRTAAIIDWICTVIIIRSLCKAQMLFGKV